MKPTLALSILLAMSASTLAQTPTVTEKPAPKPANSTVKAVPAKPSPVNVKVTPAAQKPAVVVAAKPATQKPATVAVKPATAKPASVSVQPASAKPVAVPANKTASPKPVVVSTPATKSVAGAHPVAVVAGKPAANGAKPVAVQARPGVVKAQAAPATKDPFKSKQAAAAPAKAPVGTVVAVHDNKPAADDKKKDENKKVSAAGRRDPFISPVVNLGAVGSGCTSGKRCLAIDQIALKGVVKSDNGMIAVVVNAMDKAYFLRENDPVFNGYVVKITGDSIVFKETFRDKLGKPLTRDITKTISRPVA